MVLVFTANVLIDPVVAVAVPVELVFRVYRVVFPVRVVSVNSSGREVRLRISGTSTVKVGTLRVVVVVVYIIRVDHRVYLVEVVVGMVQHEYGYMGIGGSQHALPHTGGGGGGSGMGETTDQHPGYDTTGDGGVTGHGGRGGSGIVLIQTNVAPPNGSNTAVVQVWEPASTKFTTSRFEYGIGS